MSKLDLQKKKAPTMAEPLTIIIHEDVKIAGGSCHRPKR
jgi:hypothetical protein